MLGMYAVGDITEDDWANISAPFSIVCGCTLGSKGAEWNDTGEDGEVGDRLPSVAVDGK